MPDEVVARSVVVHGLVQGVGFRWAAQNAATGLGVAGSVTNEYDGTVRCVVEGTPDRVEAMLAWLERGPRYAHVTDIDVTTIPPTGRHSFDVR